MGLMSWLQGYGDTDPTDTEAGFTPPTEDTSGRGDIWDTITGQKQMSPELQRGLLSAGLGMFAANNGRNNAFQTLGQGGLLGIQAYDEAKDKSAALQAGQQRQQAEQYKMLNDVAQARYANQMKAAGLGLAGMQVPGAPQIPLPPSMGGGTAGGGVGAGAGATLGRAALAPVAADAPAAPAGQMIDLGNSAGAPVAGGAGDAGGDFKITMDPDNPLKLTKAMQAQMGLNAAFNDGKNLWEIPATDMQMSSSGELYDKKRAPAGGFVSALGPDGVVFKMVRDNANNPYQINMPGGLEAQAARAKVAANVKNQSTLRDYYDPASKQMVSMTEADAIDAARKGQPLLASDPHGLAGNTITTVAGPGGSTVGVTAAQVQDAAASGKPLSITASPYAGQNLTDINHDFNERVYPAVQKARSAAVNTLNSLDAMETTLAGAGETGWGKDLKTDIAAKLAAAGINVDKEQLANAQAFRSVVGKRVNDVLQAQAGVASETDAKRAAETEASLTTATEANHFIVNLARATAQNDVLRADRMAAARQAALKTGDFSNIEQRVNDSIPSVFDNPLMSKWAKKKDDTGSASPSPAPAPAPSPRGAPQKAQASKALESAPVAAWYDYQNGKRPATRGNAGVNIPLFGSNFGGG